MLGWQVVRRGYARGGVYIVELYVLQQEASMSDLLVGSSVDGLRARVRGVDSPAASLALSSMFLAWVGYSLTNRPLVWTAQGAS